MQISYRSVKIAQKRTKAPEFGLMFDMSNLMSRLQEEFFPIKAFGKIIFKNFSAIVEVEFGEAGHLDERNIVTLAKARV